MTSKVIGTVYRLPENSQFASGRGAIYSISQIAPTIITMGGGGISPSLTTMQGGQREPKIVVRKIATNKH